MILLTSTSDLINVVTSGATTVECHASYVDINGATVTPGRKNTSISAATTTAIVASPAASTSRTVKTIQIRNVDTTVSQTINVLHTDGTTPVDIFRAVLAPNWSLHYDYATGWTLRNQMGLLLPPGLTTPLDALWNITVLGSDVTNNNATPNTIQDVTGLSFSLAVGIMYYFEFQILYTSAATTTGSRWTVNGPSKDLLTYRSENSFTSTTRTLNEAIAYDIPSTTNTSSVNTAGNMVTIEGWVRATDSGTLIARHASEIASSAIVAKVGSFVRWIAVG